MSATVAAVTLAWLALALLALGYAGLRLQLKDLQTGFLTRGSQTSALPRELSIVMSGGEAALVLLTTDDCPVCATILPRFQELATVAGQRVEYIVLKRQGGDEAPTAARVVVNPAAFNAVDPGYVPALVLLDENGEVKSTEPVGSKHALEAVVGRYELAAR